MARQYNVSRADLLSSRRTANVVRPRQIAMYLAKTLTLRSLPEIGRRFGGRDHTTVLHAVRKIENLVGNDNVLAEEIELLEAAAAGVSRRRTGPDASSASDRPGPVPAIDALCGNELPACLGKSTCRPFGPCRKPRGAPISGPGASWPAGRFLAEWGRT